MIGPLIVCLLTILACHWASKFCPNLLPTRSSSWLQVALFVILLIVEMALLYDLYSYARACGTIHTATALGKRGLSAAAAQALPGNLFGGFAVLWGLCTAYYQLKSHRLNVKRWEQEKEKWAMEKAKLEADRAGRERFCTWSEMEWIVGRVQADAKREILNLQQAVRVLEDKVDRQ